MSTYVQFRTSQLAAALNEGQVHPLLKRVDGTNYLWAYAIKKVNDATGENCLLAALLQALGFVWDQTQNDVANPYRTTHDFFHIDASTDSNYLVERMPDTLFQGLPTPTGAAFEVLDPTTSPLTLTAANPTLVIHRTPFGISFFEIAAAGDPDSSEKGPIFELAEHDQVLTNPRFELTVKLKGKTQPSKDDGKNGHPKLNHFPVSLPMGDVFLTLDGEHAEYFHIQHAPDDGNGPVGMIGTIKVNGIKIHAHGTALGLKANNREFNDKDDRKTRLSLSSGALTYELDNHPSRTGLPAAQRALFGIELFAAVRFAPVKGLPLTITVASDVIAARFQRMSNQGVTATFQVRMRPGHVCLRITVSGPLIQFGMESSDWPTLVESTEETILDQVEKVNDAMTYSFQLCLPLEPPLFSDVVIEKIDSPWLNWETGIPRLDQIFERIEDLLTVIDTDFDVTFPNVGRPPKFPAFKITSPDFNFEKLPEPDAPDIKFPKFTIDKPFPELPKIQPPRVPGINAETPQFDFGRLKLNFRYAINLPSVADIDYITLVITFHREWPDNVILPEVGDLLEIYFKEGPVRLPDLSIVEVVDLNPIKLKLNAKLLTPDGLPIPDLSKLDMKWRRPSLEYSRRIRFIKPATLDFDPPYDIYLEGPEFPNIDGKFVIPEFGPITDPRRLQCDISTDLTLPLVQSFLKDLLGEMPGVDFRLALPDLAFRKKGYRFKDLRLEVNGQIHIKLPVPFELSLRIPRPGVEMPKAPKLRLWLTVSMNPVTMRLVSNRIYFYFPQVEAPEESTKPKPTQQVIDFDLFTQAFPLRTEISTPPSEDSHDGYLDLSEREFVIALKYPEGQEPDPPPRISSFFPGGMDERAVELGLEGIDALPATSQDKRRLQREYTRRFRLELQKLDPETWPQEPSAGRGLYFRLNPKGITFNALLVKTEVEIDTSGHEEGQESDEGGLIKPFKLNPQDKQGDLVSRIVVIDSELREATVFAKCFVPGVENLLAIVQVSLKQKERGKLPDIIATLQLERPDETPISEFSIKLLELQLKRIEMGLIWHREEKDWDYKLIADGSIGFTGAAELIPDLEGLRTPTIQVIGLDLRKMNLRSINIPILLEKPARFEILNKQFAIELGDLTLGWDFENRIPRPRLLACKLARFEYLNPGSLEVKISVGGLEIEFDPELKARIRMPSQLGIEVSMGSGIKLGGEVGWVDTERVETGIVVTLIERFFFASVTCNVQGFEFKGLLKWGDGLKLNQKREPNIVLYGEMGMDYPLFSGVVVKELGAGFGINNRLTALPPVPNADAIISRIDTIQPEKIKSWSFVRENGQYFSVVLKTFLAGAQGEADVIQSYVAMLAFSFDTNMDAVIAGKLWLSASLKGVKENLSYPALVGALVLSPRQKKLEVVVESRPNPYIQENELLKTLFNKGKLRFSFRLMPGLVDYYLEEVSYRDKLFGVDLEFRGSYRFAIFERSVLLKSELSATGRIGTKLNAGPGGFDFGGNVSLGVGYGGLLSLNGAMAYAYLDASANFNLSAWIEIHFSISISCCGERWTKRWSVTFHGRAGSLELTLRGNIGFNDHEEGLLGIDAMIGINFPICGYRLNASGRWDVNGHIYDDVRGSISAFEGRLEERIKSSSAAQSRLKALTTKGTTAALNQPSGIAANFSKQIAAASAPASEHGEGSENWLQYSRQVEGQTEIYYLLLPKSDECWLAPRRAQVTKVTFVPGSSLRFAPFSKSLISGFDAQLTPSMNSFKAASKRNERLKFDPTSIRKISPTRWRVKDDKQGTVRYLHNRGTILTEQSPPTVVVIARKHGISFVTIASSQALVDDLDNNNVGSLTAFLDAVNKLGFKFDTGTAKVTQLQAGERWSVDGPPHVKLQTRAVSVFHNEATNQLEVCPELEIGLAGIRSETESALAKSFNGIGTLRRVVDEDTFELEPANPPTIGGEKEFSNLAAATWFEQHEEYEGLPSRADFERIPHLIDDVERLVIATGKTWKPIDEVDPYPGTSDDPPRWKLKIVGHGMQPGTRLLLRDNQATPHVYDCGWECRAEGAIDATLNVWDDDGTDYIIVDLPRVVPQPGWEVIEAKEVATFWNARNRAAGFNRLSLPNVPTHKLGVDELTQLIDDSAMFVESALGADIKQEFLPGYANYKVVFDPRLESTDRHWMTLQDQFLLPDHILSTQFRAVDENPDASATEVLQIREYLAARDQLRRNSMHNGSDPEPAEEAHQVRSRVAHAIIDDLSSRAGVEAFGEKFELYGGPTVDSKLVMGLAFKLSPETADKPIRNLDGKVYIRRKRGRLQPIQVKRPDSDEDEKLTSQIARLPIRQQFSVDHVPQTEQEVEKGRIVVKLPLRLGERLLRGVGQLGLERLGRIQILRKLPWEEKPSILRDHVRLDINTVDMPPDTSLVLANCQAEVLAPNQLSAEWSQNIDKSHVGFFLRFKGPANQKELYLITSINSGDSGEKVTLSIRGRLPSDAFAIGETVAFDIVSAGALVQSPYVFTDEFAVESRQLSDPALVAGGLPADQITIQYSLRIVPHDEAGETVENENIAKQRELGRYADWEAVTLHIPAPDTFPRQIAIAVAVESLVRDAESLIDFQLVTLAGDSPSLAAIEGIPLREADIEIWAFEEPLELTGFYAGDEPTGEVRPAVDNSKIKLTDIQNEPNFESRLGKFRIPIVHGEFLSFPSSLFSVAKGYRLFIRPSGRGDFSLLAPLQYLIVRNLPRVWDSSVRYRKDERLEFFEQATWDDIRTRRVDLLAYHQFSADDLFQEGQNALRALWNNPRILDGGAEVVIRDFDDSGFVERQLCEVLEEDRFRDLRTDFGNASYWQLERGMRRERLAARSIHPDLPHDPDRLFEYFFLNHEDLKNHPLIRPMEEAFVAFDVDLDWTALAEAGKDLVAALLQFRKSPLNLRDPRVEQTIDALLRTVRAAVIGLKPSELNGNPVAYANVLRTQDTQLRDLLQSAEQAAPGDMPTDERGFAMFLDGDTARRLSGIVRRRIAVAEDVVTLIEGQDSGSISLMASTGEKLAREEEWQRILTAAKSSFPDAAAQQEFLPVTMSFTGRVNASFVSKAKDAARQLFDMLRGLIGFSGDPVKDLDAKKKIAGVLPRAAGLSQFLDLLAETVDPSGRGRIFKRPHHSLGISANASGEVVAQETLLARYLPDSARGQSDEELPPLPRPAHRELPFRVSRLATLNQDGIVQIWSADGGSLDAQRLKRLHEIQVFDNSRTEGTVELRAADERQLLLALRPGETAQLWNVFTGERLFRMEPRIAQIGDPTYSTTAAKLVVTHRGLQAATLDHCEDGSLADRDVIRLWDIDTKSVFATLRRRAVPVKASAGPLKAAFGKGKLVWRTEGSWVENGFTAPTPKIVVSGGVSNQGEYSVTYVSPLALELDAATPPSDDGTLTGQAVSLTVTFDAASKTIQRSSGDWKADKFQDGQTLLVAKASGGSTPNSRVYKITHVDPDKLTVEQAIENESGVDYSFASFNHIDELSPAKFEDPEVLPDFAKRKFTCFCYDDNSNTACAGTAEGQIVVWRYLGKGNQLNANFLDRDGHLIDALQLRNGDDDVTAPIVRMLMVRGPEGLRLLVEADRKLYVVDPLDEAPQVILPDLPHPIRALALDAVNLRVFAGCEDKNLHILEWSSKSWRKRPFLLDEVPSSITVLRSQDTSWIGVAFGSEKPTRFFRLRDPRKASWTLEPVQSLPDSGKMVSIHSAVMPAVTSTTARSVNAAFHVWERMGFALDFALSDPLNQLFKRLELQEIVERVRRQLDEIHGRVEQRLDAEEERAKEGKLTLLRPVVSGDPHYLFTLEPREPDSTYQPNNMVGHNFINVAVVPNRFHELCLKTEPDVVCTAFLRNIVPAKGSLKAVAFGSGRLLVLHGETSNEQYVEGMRLQLTPTIGPNNPTTAEVLRLIDGDPGEGDRVVVRYVEGPVFPVGDTDFDITSKSLIEATADRSDIGTPAADNPIHVFVLSGPQRGFKANVDFVVNSRSAMRRQQRVVMQVDVDGILDKPWDLSPGPAQDPSIVAFVQNDTYQRYEQLLNWLDFRKLKASGNVANISSRTIIELLHLREVFRYIGAGDGMHQRGVLQGQMAASGDESETSELPVPSVTLNTRVYRAIKRTAGSWSADGVRVNAKVTLSNAGALDGEYEVEAIPEPRVLVLKGDAAWPTTLPPDLVLTPEGGAGISNLSVRFGDCKDQDLTRTGAAWFDNGFLVGGILTIPDSAADDGIREIESIENETIVLKCKFVPASDRSTILATETVEVGRRIGNFASPRTRAACDLAVEPQAERWLTLPSVAGWSHTAWTVPDRKGHRFEVAIRRVSRYEPLVRWALKDHTPFDVSADSDLFKEEDNRVASTDGRTFIELRKKIPSRLLHKHPLFLEIAKGPGAGQRRRFHVDPAAPEIARIDPTDPLLAEVQATNSEYRIIAHGDNWQLLEMPPILDPYQGEGDKPITVYQFPHPRQIQYTYQLPLQAARSLYNQISQIRTGYRGTDHSFRYLIYDRPKSDPQCLDNVLSFVVGVELPNLPDRQFLMRTREANGEARIRLLRHERLMTLPDMPFYYRYRMDVRSLFESRPLERDQLFESELLPSDPNLSPLAERQPSRFKILQPELNLPEDDIARGQCQDLGPETDPSDVKLELRTALDLPAYLAERGLTGIGVQLKATHVNLGSIVRDIDVTTWDGLSTTQQIKTLRPAAILATLENELKHDARTVTLKNPEVFADFTPNFKLNIENETVKVTEKRGNVFDIDRAQDLTTAVDHAAGTSAVLRPNLEWSFTLSIHVYDMEVFLPTNDDHLSLDERHSEPQKLRKQFTPLNPDVGGTRLTKLDIHAGRLPDLSTGYQLLSQCQMASSADAEVEPFIEAIVLALPWSARFQPDKFHNPCVPLVSVVKDAMRIYSPVLLHRQLVEEASPLEVPLTKIVENHTGRSEGDTKLLENAFKVTIEVFGDPISWAADGSSGTLTGIETFGPRGAQDVDPEKIKLTFNKTTDIRIGIEDEHGNTLWQFNAKASIPIEALRLSSASDDDHAQISYRAQFRIAVVEGNETFNDPSRYFLHGQRDGDCTKAIQFEVTT